MKFKTETDKILYEALELNDSIIRNRLLTITKQIKNRKKSLQQKTFWRRNAYKLKMAIQKWHKSTQGKRFHRNLGNFLATHLTKNDLGLGIQVNRKKQEQLNNNEKVILSIDNVVQILLGLNNIKTHLILELQYFEKNTEALEEFLELFFEFLNDSYNIETELLKAYITGEVSLETLLEIIDIFIFFIDERQFVYEVRQIAGKENDINKENIKEEIEKDLKLLNESENIENTENTKIDFVNKIIEKYLKKD